ncbi:phosphate/phosphite/phosphonate ABC transporter substrate-binding protein [Martelella endophytica]|nr:PhnD/SsuA/transferrin family substrate-binding protein [Martelella endophytica]
MTAVACSRMYNVSPAVKARWDDFFRWLADEAGVALDIIAYPAPAPLADLWARADLGITFMCSFPYAVMPEEDRPVPLAAPVSTASWADDKPVYASRIVARADSGLAAASLASARWAWTVRDSQSGYNAPREFLAARFPGARVATFGPVISPAGVIEAVRTGKADVGAVDAYAWQLLEMHAPEAIAELSVVATTEPAPFPMLVSSAALDPGVTERLRQALLSADRSPDGISALAPLGLSRFAIPDLAAVAGLPARAAQADAALGERW